MTHKFAAALPICVLSLYAGHAQPETIVNTSTTALFDETGGNNNSNIVTLVPPGPTDVNGLTMNVTFTPNATDIAENTNAINLLEIGGNANGSGLYLLGGQVYFLVKMSGAASNLPTITSVSGPDLAQDDANNSIGFRSGNITGISNGGLLTQGMEYSVAAILDIQSNEVTLAIKADGGSIASETWSITRDSAEWSGNNTIVSFNPPSNAGAGNNVSGPFQEGTSNMKALNGTAGQALLFNEVATVVPEPSSLALIGLGVLMIARRRRA
ncbi:MAG: PEP-CTERM sorting domain-containing protein [Planctomycetota bacterium]